MVCRHIVQFSLLKYLFSSCIIFYFLAVRFGRVPKHEKVRMAEELARVSERTLTDAVQTALINSDSVLESCFTGFLHLIDNVKKLLDKPPIQTFCPVGRYFLFYIFVTNSSYSLHYLKFSGEFPVKLWTTLILIELLLNLND